MALLAFAVPVLPGKSDAWRRFIADLQGPRHAEYVAATIGVRERVFLQSTPYGDTAIVTMEGDDPREAIHLLSTTQSPYHRWLAGQLADVYGVQLAQFALVPPPRLVLDSQAA